MKQCMKMDNGVDFPSTKKKWHNRYKVWPSNICDKVVWFFFHYVMMHAAKNMKWPFNILQSMIKVFSMFNISIWDYKENFEDYPGISCIWCNKVDGYEL